MSFKYIISNKKHVITQVIGIKNNDTVEEEILFP